MACLALALWACSGLGGLATGSKEGEAGSGPGGALDDFKSGSQVAGVGNAGPGSGGFPGAGGNMTGGDPTNPGGGIPPGGGSSGPFGGVGGTGGGGGQATGGGSGECSGGFCSDDSTTSFLIGNFTISATLFVDPDTQGGNCNDLIPPTVMERQCHYVQNGSASDSGVSLAWLWMGTARALPKSVGGGGTDGGLERELVCEDVPVQPPIDPAKIPRIVLHSDRSLPTGPTSNPTVINDKQLIPKCSASGQWQLTTDSITVYLSPYSDDRNYWVIQVEALYPKDGAFVSRGTRTVTMHCVSKNEGVFCEEKAPSPMGDVLAAPAADRVLSQ